MFENQKKCMILSHVTACFNLHLKHFIHLVLLEYFKVFYLKGIVVLRWNKRMAYTLLICCWVPYLFFVCVYCFLNKNVEYSRLLRELKNQPCKFLQTENVCHMSDRMHSIYDAFHYGLHIANAMCLKHSHIQWQLEDLWHQEVGGTFSFYSYILLLMSQLLMELWQEGSSNL